MKYRLLIVFLAGLTVSQGCFLTKNSAKRVTKKIAGTWTYAKVDFNEADAEKKSQIVKYLGEKYKGSFLELKRPDMSYTRKFSDETSAGIWSISDNGKELHFSDGKVYLIEELSLSELTVAIRGETRNSDIFLYLKKKE